jgi:hypothetical protein
MKEEERDDGRGIIAEDDGGKGDEKGVGVVAKDVRKEANRACTTAP